MILRSTIGARVFRSRTDLAWDNLGSSGQCVPGQFAREAAFFDVEEREEVPMRHELLFRKDLMGCASRLCRNCAKNGRFLAFSRSISQCYMLY